MTYVWLVRHTETDWNAESRYQGRSDRPLTPAGEKQVAAVSALFRGAPIAAVTTTGLARTDILAQAIAGQAGGAKTRADARWREVDHGTWEGLTYAEALARFGPSVAARNDAPWSWDGHGGETLATVFERVRAAWDDICGAPEGGGRVVVSHATPIQLILCHLLDVPPTRYWQIRIDLGGITHLELFPSGAIAQFVNRAAPAHVEE